MHHSNRRFLKACWKLTKISYYRRPHAPNAEDPTTGNLLYLYALPALALAFAPAFAPVPGLRALRRPLRPRKRPRAPQHLDSRPQEVAGRPPPALSRY